MAPSRDRSEFELRHSERTGPGLETQAEPLLATGVCEGDDPDHVSFLVLPKRVVPLPASSGHDPSITA